MRWAAARASIQPTIAAVRVAVSRIRKRLQQYYESEGAAHTLRIVLSGNGYVPEFLRKGEPAGPGDPAPQPVGPDPRPASGFTRSHRILTGFAVLALAATFLAVTLRNRS